MPKLKNTRHERFCLEYLRDFNAAAAARRSQYSAKAAKQEGFRLLRRPDIQARLAELAEGVLEKLEISVDRIAEEYARIGFHDPRWTASWDEYGQLQFKPSAEISDVEAAAIKSIKRIETKEGVRLEITYHDKLGALDSLAKFKQMFAAEEEGGKTPFVVLIPEPMSMEEWQERFGRRKTA